MLGSLRTAALVYTMDGSQEEETDFNQNVLVQGRERSGAAWILWTVLAYLGSVLGTFIC